MAQGVKDVQLKGSATIWFSTWLQPSDPPNSVSEQRVLVQSRAMLSVSPLTVQ